MASGVYKNQVVEEYVNEFLTTLVDLEGMVTVDNSLQAQDGDTVRIYQYTLSGQADKVQEGYGNSHSVDISGTYADYTVAMAQAKCAVTDEAVNRNPLLVDEKIKGVAKAIYNLETGDITGEWNKCSADNHILTHDSTNSLDYFDQLMQAQYLISTAIDGEANGPFWLVCDAEYFKALKKSLKSNVMVEYDMINGKRYPVVGGIPVKVSSAIKNIEYTVGSGESAVDYDVHAFLVDKTAVKLFRGKSVSAESDRDADKRTTEYFARDNYVCAIEFTDRAVALMDAQPAS